MDIKYRNGTFVLNIRNTDIYDFFSAKGFIFSREVLSRYFLSLKTKPFVILTGISGTGKTKIAQIFADYVLQDESEEERARMVAFMPVRPDWMDNKGLLGYFNILDGKYQSTPLLDLIQHANKNPEKPHFVTLDEMNLAKVEYYFSDFLSIMESRTKDKPKGEPLILHQNGKVSDLAGNRVPEQIHLPQNIFFTGTVNVDETTYMFSPKVLDRANVIEFNEVFLDNSSEGIFDKDQFVFENQDVRDALLEREKNRFCSYDDYREYQTIPASQEENIIQELLDLLKPYNMHFGYRVVNEMSRFIFLANEYVQAFSLEDAVDIQILQKILPKFHGTKGKLEQPLKDFMSFCLGNEAGTDGDKNEEIRNARFPRSAAKVERMLNNLDIQGYTSFIE